MRLWINIFQEKNIRSCNAFIDWDIENNGGIQTSNFAYAEIFQFLIFIQGQLPRG